MPAPGTCPYRPLRPLGGGQMMRVDEAEGPAGRVAIKRPRLPVDARWLAQEAALLARLPGIGLADIIDQDPHGAWLALRLLPGPGLTRWARGRPLAPVVSALAHLADTLAALHAAGLAHGDVKPGNVIMGADARPRLIDLGLAATPAGAPGFHGTYGAASPEQLRGAAPTPASDVFALGALAFRAITGGRPFTAQREAQALLPTDVLPWSPAMVRPGVPADLDALVVRMLDRDPARRPPAAGLGPALRASLDSPPLRLHPVVFLHWRQASRLLVAAADQGTPGLLVVFGADAEARRALCTALADKAVAEGMPVGETGPTGLVHLHGPDAPEAAAALARAGAPCLVLVQSPTPLPALADLGAVHVHVRLPARRPAGGDTDRLLAALQDGPRSLEALAAALDLRPHAVLDLAEPLLERGRLIECEGGAALGLRPR